MKKNRKGTEAATEAIGYLLVFVGLISVVASFLIGNIFMAGSVLSSIGLGFLAENSGLLLWLGLAVAAAGAVAVATSNVDVEE
jgi:hypothetical protein